jgi:hypothetical protein
MLRGDLLGRGPIAAASASLAALALMLVYLGYTTPPSSGASIELADVPGAEPREAVATITFDDPAVAENTDWLYGLAWQGGGEPLRLEELRRIAPGTYETPPIPVGGSWKSGIRVQSGNEMGSIPLYAPADSAIPVGEIPAPASFERAFVDDRSFLQRERKEDVPQWSIVAFGVAVAGFVLALLIATGWALVRVARLASRPVATEPPEEPTAIPPARPPALV